MSVRIIGAARLGMVCAAMTAGALTTTSSAHAFDIHVQTPPNGYVVKVPAASTAWVRFSILFSPDGCSHEGGLVYTRFGNVQFAPARGGGLRFSNLLLRPGHRLVQQPPPTPLSTSGFSVVGDAAIPGPDVSNGELLRWTLTALCSADTGTQGGELAATAAGTLRIERGAATATPTRTNAPVPFRITRIVSPTSVRQNGSRGTAAIYWSGNPTFPVTMHDAPASCPEGMTCVTESRVVHPRANPLRWAVWFCTGDATADSTIDFRYWLTDAKGQSTQKVRQSVVCKVG